MEEPNFNKPLSFSKHLFTTNHKSAKKIPNPTLLSNKLKIHFPFLSPMRHRKTKEKFWTERGKKWKTEEVESSRHLEIKKMCFDNEKDENIKIVGETNDMGKERINQFLKENPEPKLIQFEQQVYQTESQKLKTQLRNLEQTQSQLFHRIQSLNYQQPTKTEHKNTNTNRVVSKDFLPSLRTTGKQIKMKKGEERTDVGLNEMMITFCPGKKWKRID